MRRLLLAFTAVSVGLTACTTTGAARTDGTPVSSSAISAELGMPNVPVDTSLEPISRSTPSQAAAAALALCVREGEIHLVSGMAQLPAREVHRFMLTNGKEPELQDDALVFAVQFKGAIPERYGAMIDPLCVVFEDGTRFYYMPYGTQEKPSKVPSDFTAATVALPPLAP